MIRIVDVLEPATLDDYRAHAQLAQPVRDLVADAQELGGLRGRRVWMINSTAKGGGVAEMMPKLVTLLRELGVRTEWAVIDVEDPDFFDLTKRLHNLLHGEGHPALSAADREGYARTSRALADAFRPLLEPGDLLVVHDPQPLGMGALLRREVGLPAVWRCHIGLDESTPQTEAAWAFLRPHAEAYDRAVFTVRDYAPSFLANRASILPPAIDPLSPKNEALLPFELTDVLRHAGLLATSHPVLTPPFEARARRLQADGSFGPATAPDDLGLLFRPIVTQVSRWDRLKGWLPLLGAFAALKSDPAAYGVGDAARARVRAARLVLAGPDPTAVEDDPEGREAFEEVRAAWQALDPSVRSDVAVLVLPMVSRRQNALMVNALQQCSTVVAQNSLREGFGLTVTEGMWKRCAVLGSRAVGIRSQVRDGEEGRLVDDPQDRTAVARALGDLLADPDACRALGRNGQRRVAEHYLVFAQVRRWIDELRTLTRIAEAAA